MSADDARTCCIADYGRHADNEQCCCVQQKVYHYFFKKYYIYIPHVVHSTHLTTAIITNFTELSRIHPDEELYQNKRAKDEHRRIFERF